MRFTITDVAGLTPQRPWHYDTDEPEWKQDALEMLTDRFPSYVRDAVRTWLVHLEAALIVMDFEAIHEISTRLIVKVEVIDVGKTSVRESDGTLDGLASDLEHLVYRCDDQAKIATGQMRMAFLGMATAYDTAARRVRALADKQP